jgi:hypothetical protein
MNNRSELYAGIIWITSAIALAIYGVLLFLNSEIPGMGELVNFISGIDSKYIYLAAFISIFIEGLYFVGSFFPGASLVIIMAIISGTNGTLTFIITLSLIFIGWSIAGFLNIFLANIYRERIIRLKHSEDYFVKDRTLTTWFPAFRSSYEVAQVIEGGHPIKIFLSSLRVRFWSTLFVGGLALIVPLLIDIKSSSDHESFLIILVVFGISLTVGFRKVKRYFSARKLNISTHSQN